MTFRYESTTGIYNVFSTVSVITTINHLSSFSYEEVNQGWFPFPNITHEEYWMHTPSFFSSWMLNIWPTLKKWVWSADGWLLKLYNISKSTFYNLSIIIIQKLRVSICNRKWLWHNIDAFRLMSIYINKISEAIVLRF